MEGKTSYYTREWAVNHSKSPDVHLKAEAACRIIHRLPGVHTVLDVGCASGVLVKMINRYCTGKHAVGVDSSPDTVWVAEGSTLPGWFSTGTPRDIVQQGYVFNCVVVMHVLEHQEDPAGMLSTVRSLLTPRGYLLVTVPNALAQHGFWERQVGWIVNDADHRQKFDPDTLHRLVSGSGFRVRRCWTKTYSPEAVTMTASAVYRRFANANGGSGPASLVKDTNTLAYSRLGRAIGWLPARISEMRGSGTEIMILAVRR